MHNTTPAAAIAGCQVFRTMDAEAFARIVSIVAGETADADALAGDTSSAADTLATSTCALEALLDRMAEDASARNDPSNARIRRAAKRMVTAMDRAHYGGGTQRDFIEAAVRREVAKWAASEALRCRDLDAKAANATALRRARIERLHGLAQVQEPLPGIFRDSRQFGDAGRLLGAGDDAPPAQRYTAKRTCYVCKARFGDVHFHYDQMCPPCASLNWAKRNQTADMAGMTVLLTGSRVKIGFEAGLRVLRCGATLVATSRFPRDCLRRYAAEDDYAAWKHRLHVYGLDLRDLGAVVRFCDLLAERHGVLHAVINNAAQTVRRPAAYYRHLLPLELGPSAGVERAALCGSPAANAAALTNAHSAQASCSALMSQIVVVAEDAMEDTSHAFPEACTDTTGQQLDRRTTNSWRLRLHEVEPGELVETFCINALAPFILNARLKPLLAAARGGAFIVNVSAMEAVFHRAFKTVNHPHTNAAKAALNMLTRTSAADYAADSIYMTSVDTGWVNDENPDLQAACTRERHNFQTPLDEVDGAARILDPILSALNGQAKVYGVFLKDYAPSVW